ncbi:MAG: phosphoribosylformylglycinamidine synthase subunit PurS [Proteobacteria bacterium]|jgi:phosphoribosylformylglycinamidine synthase|nr:phosphoribosylformylglycinamidine synthase subunit PurS [Alphaproteobacteria bacterium]NCC02591.1 phosphoribosylformylglycinamidine synthase subunit PurS [Pseudomonadota bacterium]
MKVRIDIMLKNGVLDPQGKAISHALGNLGFEKVEDVRVGKTIILTTSETDEAKAIAAAKSMSEKILANMVIEDFVVTIL